MGKTYNGEWTYGALDARLGSKSQVKVAHNTVARRVASAIVVCFHVTDVATLTADGLVRLNTGGYQTVTTKVRLNAVLPTGMGVSQRDFAWYLTTWGPMGDSSTPFTDGMVVDTATGRVISKVAA